MREWPTRGIAQEVKGRLEATTGLMSVMGIFHQLTSNSTLTGGHRRTASKVPCRGVLDTPERSFTALRADLGLQR